MSGSAAKVKRAKEALAQVRRAAQLARAQKDGPALTVVLGLEPDEDDEDAKDKEEEE